MGENPILGMISIFQSLKFLFGKKGKRTQQFQDGLTKEMDSRAHVSVLTGLSGALGPWRLSHRMGCRNTHNLPTRQGTKQSSFKTHLLAITWNIDRSITRFILALMLLGFSDLVKLEWKCCLVIILSWCLFK